jgi:hypothetical protein
MKKSLVNKITTKGVFRDPEKNDPLVISVKRALR